VRLRTRLARVVLQRPRQLLAVVAVTFGVAAAYASYGSGLPVGTSQFGGPPPPASLQVILDDLFVDGGCITASQAAEAMKPRMAAAGFGQWTFRTTGGENAECVGAAVDMDANQVVFIAAIPAAIQAQLSLVADQLLEQCQTADEASEMIRSALREAGVEGVDWELVRTGSIYGPSDLIEEIRRHVSSGCATFGGSGWTAAGVRRFYVSAR
jgi:hypothetical protein